MSDFYNNVDKVFASWNYATPKLLYGLVRALKPSVVVDVGTFRGYSAAWMAKAIQENNSGRVYAIDDFSLKQFTPDRDVAVAHFWDNLTRLGVKDWVTLIEGKTTEVEWPGEVHFAYIDASHSYLNTRHDFDKCASAGAECICLDDAEQSVGPRMVVQEVRQLGWAEVPGGYWDVINVNRDCGMAVCMRRSNMGPVTFSQEDPTSPGLDFQTVSKANQLKHLEDMSRIYGVDYAPVLEHLHPGKR